MPYSTMKHSCYTGWIKGDKRAWSTQKNGSKTGTVIPVSSGVKCYICSRPTRSEKIYCKKCRWETHYSRRVGSGAISLEEFVNDPFYD